MAYSSRMSAAVWTPSQAANSNLLSDTSNASAPSFSMVWPQNCALSSIVSGSVPAIVTFWLLA